MKQSTFIFLTTILVCNSTFQLCSDSDSQELSTELEEDSSWEYTKETQQFPPTPPLSSLPSFDGLRDCPRFWRNQSK